jgi:hypothetical protein
MNSASDQKSARVYFIIFYLLHIRVSVGVHRCQRHKSLVVRRAGFLSQSWMLNVFMLKSHIFNWTATQEFLLTVQNKKSTAK